MANFLQQHLSWWSCRVGVFRCSVDAAGVNLFVKWFCIKSSLLSNDNDIWAASTYKLLEITSTQLFQHLTKAQAPATSATNPGLWKRHTVYVGIIFGVFC